MRSSFYNSKLTLYEITKKKKKQVVHFGPYIENDNFILDRSLSGVRYRLP